MLCSAFLALTAFGPLIQRPAAPPAPEAPPAESGRGARGRKRDDKGPPVLGADDVPEEEGVPGSLPPLVRRLELSAASVDLDTFGRSRAELEGLATAADGFNVLMSDDRDGNRGYVVLALDSELAPRKKARALDEQASGKGQTDATIAASDVGALGAVWLDVSEHSHALRGRAWDAQGLNTATWSIPLPVDSRARVPNPVISGAAPLGLDPSLLFGESNWTLAWQIAGHILVRDVDPANGATISEEVLGHRDQLATSGPLLARNSAGGIACAYDSSGGVEIFVHLSADEKASCAVAPGRVFGLVADATSADAGWWILYRSRGRLVLRHLERSGAADREELQLLEPGWRTASLANSPQGPCALVQPAKGGLDALWVHDGTTSASVTKTEVCAAERSVIASRLAFRGEHCAFVWSERRGNLVDVVARSCDRDGAGLSAERQLVDGDGSALQHQPALAFAGERGVVAWTDWRFGAPVVAARGLTAGRKQGNGELFLPADAGSASALAAKSDTSVRPAAKRPAVAVAPSGQALLSWYGVGAFGPTVFAQLIEIDGAGELHTKSKAIELDPASRDISTAFAPAIVALRGERGFAVAWVRANPEAASKSAVASEDGRSEVRLLRMNAAGELDGSPRTIGNGSRLARPALTQLDDARVLLAWDSQPHVKARRLAARVFSERLEPEERELCFETMWRKSDYAATIAPAEGGFAMAWTSGEDQDSDVFARLFDTEGHPLSRPVALSTRAGAQRMPSLSRTADGSFIAVWQDNLSLDARLVGRRLSAKGTQPGREVRFCFGPELKADDFSSPGIVALEDGRLLLGGEHVVAGKGREIGMCLVGTGWDEVEGR